MKLHRIICSNTFSSVTTHSSCVQTFLSSNETRNPRCSYDSSSTTTNSAYPENRQIVPQFEKYNNIIWGVHGPLNGFRYPFFYILGFRIPDMHITLMGNIRCSVQAKVPHNFIRHIVFVKHCWLALCFVREI